MALSESEELELLTLEKERAFASTQGGAATGNPNLRRQGDRQKRDFGSVEPLLDIGGAAAIGGALGAGSSEILRGAGSVIGSMPYPAARTVGGFLSGAGDVLKAGGRVAPTIAGAISGGVSETAGQVAEGLGAPQPVAEGARIVGGLVSPIPDAAALSVLRKYAMVPALGLMSKFKHEAAKTLIQKIDNGTPLDDQERALFARMTAELRGGAKSDAPLESVGNSMDQYGQNKVLAATQGVGNADMYAGSIGTPTPAKMRELADVGTDLRTTITGRNAKLKGENDALYAKNEEARDAIVAANEAAGNFVNKTPEFKGLLQSLKSNLEPGKRSPDVQKTYSHILAQLGVSEPSTLERSLAQIEGREAEKSVQLSFQALDDIRRNLGEVLRWKPPEGYASIAASDARKYYAQISDIQKKFAGGDAGPQAQLLDDYARGKEGLEPFISAKGRKATALDRYDDSQFVTDASKLPDTYFKTREGVKALKELTGDPALVNKAAQEYVNKKLEGASAAETTKFLRDNASWLEKEIPLVRNMIAAHADSLAVAERGVTQARAFADEAASTNKALLGGRFPADRVRNLVASGDADLWAKAGPAIAASPDGKANVLSAVRQVLADKPITPDQFSRQLRPALKGSGLADDAALDLIQTKLQAIREMKIPEAEKLGIYRRAVLQAISGYTASGLARGTVEAAKAVPY